MIKEIFEKKIKSIVFGKKSNSSKIMALTILFNDVFEHFKFDDLKYYLLESINCELTRLCSKDNIEKLWKDLKNNEL